MHAFPNLTDVLDEMLLVKMRLGSRYHVLLIFKRLSVRKSKSRMGAFEHTVTCATHLQVIGLESILPPTLSSGPISPYITKTNCQVSLWFISLIIPRMTGIPKVWCAHPWGCARGKM